MTLLPLGLLSPNEPSLNVCWAENIVSDHEDAGMGLDRLRDLRAVAAHLGGHGLSRPAAAHVGRRGVRLDPGDRGAPAAVGPVSRRCRTAIHAGLHGVGAPGVVERTIAWVGV